MIAHSACFLVDTDIRILRLVSALLCSRVVHTFGVHPHHISSLHTSQRLMTVYLMKLKDNAFASEAGSCWRQLFVATLCPWLMKYRVFSEERILESLDLYVRKMERLKREERGLAEKVVGEVKDGLQMVVDELVDSRPQQFEESEHATERTGITVSQVAKGGF